MSGESLRNSIQLAHINGAHSTHELMQKFRKSKEGSIGQSDIESLYKNFYEATESAQKILTDGGVFLPYSYTPMSDFDLPKLLTQDLLEFKILTIPAFQLKQFHLPQFPIDTSDNSLITLLDQGAGYNLFSDEYQNVNFLGENGEISSTFPLAIHLAKNIPQLHKVPGLSPLLCAQAILCDLSLSMGMGKRVIKTDPNDGIGVYLPQPLPSLNV